MILHKVKFNIIIIKTEIINNNRIKEIKQISMDKLGLKIKLIKQSIKLLEDQ